MESKALISNRENIEIYYVNLNVFSIGIELFAFNELGSVAAANKGSQRDRSIFGLSLICVSDRNIYFGLSPKMFINDRMD
mgnify:CR=1 FL=1